MDFLGADEVTPLWYFLTSLHKMELKEYIRFFKIVSKLKSSKQIYTLQRTQI